MKSFKLASILLCLALLSEQSHAVLNKNTKNTNNENHVSDTKTKNAADRISNDYGPPRPGFNGPAPVYGPPELTGNHGPVQVFPPPPPELPPPPPPSVHSGLRPHTSFGPPPRKPPPQLQFAPRPGKPAPWKLSPPPPRFPGNKPPGHGPPIPITLEAYGPPNNLPPPSFSPSQNQYGPPPPLPPIPQPPPPGVPAPPTPPDIKYDGWQPIAGHIDNTNVNPRQPTAPDHEANVNYPSDSYGEPINNPEDHNLKQSIGQNGDGQGLPPPVLPESEPLHNIQEPIKDSPSHVNGLEVLPTASGLSTSFDDSPPGHDSNHGNLQDHDHSFQQLTPPGPSLIDSYGPPPPISFGNGHFSSSQASSHASSHGSSHGLSHGSSHTLSHGLSHSVPHVSTHGFGFTPGFNSNALRQNRHNSFHSNHHIRGHAPFRPPNGLSNTLIPPKSRAPMKFRDSVPPGLFNSINHYLPPPPVRPGPSNKPANVYGPPLPPPPRFGFNLQQQLPTLNHPLTFNLNAQSTSAFTSFGTSGPALDKSPLAAPNVNYGTPLSFTNFNTPSPVLTYGAPNFVPANSFTTNMARGNLYDQHTSLTTSYGSPLSPPPSNLFNGHNECSGYQKPIETSIPLPTFPQYPQGNSISTNGVDFPLPSINELELEFNQSNDQQIDLKDSYGNPTGGAYDQRSSSSITHSNSQSILNNEATAEALTAALTEQGYRQTSDDYNAQQSSNSYKHAANNIAAINPVNINQLIQSPEDTEPAMALAQTLSAEGAASDGFQIQGSKGTYTLQIQSSNGLHQNSDGTIRHDQILSNGLLQDILAAIEEPGDGKNQLVEIQGSPQTQQNPETHQHGYGQRAERNDDLYRAESSSLVSAGNSNSNTAANHEDVALFFNNNYGNDLTKEIRSTAKSEGNIENSTKASEEKTRKESS